MKKTEWIALANFMTRFIDNFDLKDDERLPPNFDYDAVRAIFVLACNAPNHGHSIKQDRLLKELKRFLTDEEWTKNFGGQK